MKKSLIILSGGIDSTTLLYEKKDDIAMAISFDYGAAINKKEIPFARLHCEQLGIPHATISLEFIKKFFKSSLLASGESDEEFSQSTAVPFRNGIMLSIAAGIAESKDLENLLIANHFGDHAIYPDCRKKFILSMQAAISSGTYKNVQICAPYTEKQKNEVVSIGIKNKVEFAKTWSCYRGEEIHCGECATCIERKNAFKKAGVLDPTKYRK
jgi:7-cyano-7-deazaguanine synthase